MTDGGAPAPGHDLQQVRTVDREQQRTPPELSKANTAHVLDEEDDPTSPRQMGTPNPWSRRPTSLDLDDYFVCSALR